jgi:uncharacterized protein (DUF433 family)
MATERDADVPDPDHPRIVADERFGGRPRLRGRRITVLDVYEGVTEGEGDLTPEEFAETFRLPVSDVYRALAYYHDHREEMERQREARDRTAGEVRARIAESRPDSIEPDPDG